MIRAARDGRTDSLLVSASWFAGIGVAAFLGMSIGRGQGARAVLVLALLGIALAAMLAPVVRVVQLVMVLAALPLTNPTLGRDNYIPMLVVLALFAIAVRRRRADRHEQRGELPGWNRLPAGVSVGLMAMVASSLLALFNSGGNGIRLFVYGALLVWWAYELALIGLGSGATEALLEGWCLAAVVSAAVALIQQRFGFAWLSGQAITASVIENGVSVTRLNGPIGDYELFGEYMALALVGILHLATRAKGGLHRAGWAALAIPVAVALLATGTRGALLQFLVSAALYLLLRGPGVASTLRRLAVLVGLLVVATVVASGVIAQIPAVQRFSVGVTPGSGLGGLINRTTVWDRFDAVAGDHLWSAFGNGVAYPYEQIQQYPHSLVMYLAYTVGVVGLLAMMFLLGALARGAFMAWRRSESNADYGLLMLVMLGGWVASELKIEYLRSPTYEFVVWSFVGLAAASGRVHPVQVQPAADLRPVGAGPA